ncbi:IL2RA protein, partial [Ardeotis kori]|nr:IL2RA protein [Ardeotis kori]
CPPLPTIKFADVIAETYPLETKLYYECDSGYTRKSGQYLGIQCQNIQCVASWVYKDFQCIGNLVYPTCLYFVRIQITLFQEQKQQVESISFKCVLPCDPTDFCGPPKTFPHASLRQKKQYTVGQVLHFKCQSGYDKGPLTSGTCTCKKVNGKIIWTSLNVRCTNDS